MSPCVSRDRSREPNLDNVYVIALSPGSTPSNYPPMPPCACSLFSQRQWDEIVQCCAREGTAMWQNSSKTHCVTAHWSALALFSHHHFMPPPAQFRLGLPRRVSNRSLASCAPSLGSRQEIGCPGTDRSPSHYGTSEGVASRGEDPDIHLCEEWAARSGRDERVGVLRRVYQSRQH